MYRCISKFFPWLICVIIKKKKIFSLLSYVNFFFFFIFFSIYPKWFCDRSVNIKLYVIYPPTSFSPWHCVTTWIKCSPLSCPFFTCVARVAAGQGPSFLSTNHVYDATTRIYLYILFIPSVFLTAPYYLYYHKSFYF